MADGDTGRVDYLDGIRARRDRRRPRACTGSSWYSPFFHGGSIGVDIFFVLSGFIITTMLWRAPATGTLAAGLVGPSSTRRVVRLYPALLGLVVGCVVLYAVDPCAPLEPARGGPPRRARARPGLRGLGGRPERQLLAARRCTRSGRPGRWPIEWYFYLLWPLAVLGARGRGVVRARLAIASLAAAVAAVPRSPCR